MILLGCWLPPPGSRSFPSSPMETNDSASSDNSSSSSQRSQHHDASEGDAMEVDRPSETRLIREMGKGVRDLVSSRPAPTRHEPPAPTNKPIKVNTLFNYA